MSLHKPNRRACQAARRDDQYDQKNGAHAMPIKDFDKFLNVSKLFDVDFNFEQHDASSSDSIERPSIRSP